MSAPTVEFQHVYKTYKVADSEYHALNDVSMTIQEKEFIAIVGPSGSGKSTLMHVLGFMDQPTAGEIVFEGKPATKLTGRQRAKLRGQKIGFVFQAFNLLPRLSVLDNAMLPLYYSPAIRRGQRKRAMAMLERVGLADRAQHRPNQLSGGQRQRVAIARALINEPSLILADEPTGNLDSVNSERILELFSELHREGRTIILVTHDNHIAQIAKRRVYVKDGRVSEVNSEG